MKGLLVLVVLCLASVASGATGKHTLPASNDGVVLHYGLSVPHGVQGRLPMVVDVSLSEELDIAKVPYWEPAADKFIVLKLPPFGRGGCQWTPFAERDSLQIIGHVMATQQVDRDRVYLLGATQGFRGNGYGTKKLQYGTLNLAYHNPDLFAAVATGVEDLYPEAYRGTWLGDWHQYQLQYAFPLRLREMPILWCDNLLATPTWLLVSSEGRKAMQLYHAMDKQAPARLKLSIAPGLKQTPIPRKLAREQIQWLLEQRMDRLPKRVVVATNTLKHSKNRWAKVDALSEVNRFCRLEARITDDGRIKVRGANFESFSLRSLDKLLPGRASLHVDIEHQVVKVSAAKALSFRRKNGKWEVGAVPRQGKSAGMADTIIDAFTEPYLLVVGSQDPSLRQLALDTMKAIQNGGLSKPVDLSPIVVLADDKVGPAQMKAKNLILFGDERTNSIIARINAKLPIRLAEGRIISGERTFSYPDQGLMMVYPNPLAPGRKVVIVTGAAYKGYFLTAKAAKKLAKAPFPENLPAHGWPLLGDWVVFRANGKGFAKKGRGLQGLDNAVVEGGFFDAQWKPMAGPYYFFNRNFAK